MQKPHFFSTLFLLLVLFSPSAQATAPEGQAALATAPPEQTAQPPESPPPGVIDQLKELPAEVPHPHQH